MAARRRKTKSLKAKMTKAMFLQEEESLRDVYNTLCLPVPATQETAKIRLGRLLPLEDYGCLLRIEKADAQTTSLPISLQPLASFDVRDRWQVRLYPAVSHVGINKRDFLQLCNIFTRKDFRFEATREDDCGYILHTHPDTGKTLKLPVLIDTTDILKWGILNRKDQRLNEPQKRLVAQLRTAQKKLYGDLKEKYQTLAGAPKNKKKKLAREFWAAMRSAVNDNRLGVAWKKASGYGPDSKAEKKRCVVNEASVKYARRLRMDIFHAAILKAG